MKSQQIYSDNLIRTHAGMTISLIMSLKLTWDEEKMSVSVRRQRQQHRHQQQRVEITKLNKSRVNKSFLLICRTFFCYNFSSLLVHIFACAFVSVCKPNSMCYALTNSAWDIKYRKIIFSRPFRTFENFSSCEFMICTP